MLRNSCKGQGFYFPKTLPSLRLYQTYQINPRARLRRDGADLNESVRKAAFSPARERETRMQEKNEKELLQARHRLEEAQMRDRVKERKARTRRLIQTGAILEKAFPAAATMDLKTLEEKLFTLFQ